jgi:hypothetical protein
LLTYEKSHLQGHRFKTQLPIPNLIILIFVVATQELLKKAQPLRKGLHNSKQQLHSTVNPTHHKSTLGMQKKSWYVWHLNTPEIGN